MNELLIKDNEKIENMIHEIRGKQVMLDSDLARLYNVETKVFNQAIKRNIQKFPERFMFQLTKEEYNYLRSQIVTSNTRGGRRYNPYVFTEHGIAMLSNILHSNVATEISIKIIDAFIFMRKYISNNLIDQQYINELVLKDNKRIDLLENTFLKFKDKTNHLFFEGQIYDAYSLLIDILKNAKKEIILIDNYAGKELFDILKNIKCNIKIVTKNIDEESIKKYNKQYNNIEIVISDKFHDRFIILDNNTLYHSGSSFKDIGKKCFAISKIEDLNIIKNILDYINK